MTRARFVGLLTSALLVFAADSASAASLRSKDVCKAFRVASLDAAPCTRMAKDDFGLLAPPTGVDARRFLIDDLCELIDEDPCDSGGRVLIFKRMAELRRFEAYYDSFGEEGDPLFSWTFVNKRHRLLVQINGELPRESAVRYQSVVAGL